MLAVVHCMQQLKNLQTVSAKYPNQQIVQTATGQFSAPKKAQTVSGQFLEIWEQSNNPGFNPVEFDGIKKLAGLNSFTLTPKQWIEHTDAIGADTVGGDG